MGMIFALSKYNVRKAALIKITYVLNALRKSIIARPAVMKATPLT